MRIRSNPSKSHDPVVVVCGVDPIGDAGILVSDHQSEGSVFAVRGRSAIDVNWPIFEIE